MEISQLDLLCVCAHVQGKHSDFVIFAPLAPVKTQHIDYAQHNLAGEYTTAFKCFQSS